MATNQLMTKIIIGGGNFHHLHPSRPLTLHAAALILLALLCSACGNSLTTATEPPAEAANSPISSVTPPPASGDSTLCQRLPGTWRLAGYYHTSAPHVIMQCYGTPHAVVTPDSLFIYSGRYESTSFSDTPVLVTVLTAAYGYRPVPPSAIVVGSDTVRLYAIPTGLRLEGSELGAVLGKDNN